MGGFDYNGEIKKLEDAIDWFKPEAGQIKLKILSEPIERTQDFTDSKGVVKSVEQIVIDVEVDGKKMKWSVTKGLTKSSLYGQMMIIGQKFKGLTNANITLLIKQGQNRKDYTILEAI